MVATLAPQWRAKVAHVILLMAGPTSPAVLF